MVALPCETSVAGAEVLPALGRHALAAREATTAVLLTTAIVSLNTAEGHVQINTLPTKEGRHRYALMALDRAVSSMSAPFQPFALPAKKDSPT